MKRVSLRLIPFLFVLFVFNQLDRTNVAIAALQMNRDLRFSATAYSFGSAIFYIGYALFEVPSNLILARVGARRWMARIMITWGLIASAMMFVRTPLHFYVLRFLLGAAEAGFFPGMVYYLNQWFPAAHRGRALSRFIMAVPITAVIGSPLSASLLGLDGWHGLTGWQWVFVLEGIPSVLIGIAVLAVLTDAPSRARWLAADQREWLLSRLARDAEESPATHMPTLQALMLPAVWLLSIVYFSAMTANWSYAYWAPLMIRDVLHVSNMATGTIAGGIACLAAVVMLVVGASSDRTGERFLHAAGCLSLEALGFALAALAPQALMRVAGLALVMVGVQSFPAPFWCVPSALLRGTAAAAGIALVNSLGNVGGAIGPTLLGVLQDTTGSMRAGMLAIALLAGCGAVLLVGLRWHSAFAVFARPGVRGRAIATPADALLAPTLRED
jgi:ACS family tartrate transporter-like MFS transporter